MRWVPWQLRIRSMVVLVALLAVGLAWVLPAWLQNQKIAAFHGVAEGVWLGEAARFEESAMYAKSPDHVEGMRKAAAGARRLAAEAARLRRHYRWRFW